MTDLQKLQLIKKFRMSTTLFHKLIINEAEVHDSLLEFKHTDEEGFLADVESVYNTYKQDIRDAICKKDTYSQRELKYYNTIMAEAIGDFGFQNILGEKDLTEQMEVYIYLEAKRLLTELREEYIYMRDTHLQKKNDIKNATNNREEVASLANQLTDLHKEWSIGGYKYEALVKETLEKERERVKELLKY